MSMSYSPESFLMDAPGNMTDQKPTVRDFFDRSDAWQGRLYDNHVARFDQAMVRRKNYTLEMLGYLDDLPEGARVLDVGCGCGEYLEALQKRGCDVYGIDLSPRMLDACRKRLVFSENDATQRLLCGDIEALPFEDASFDLILCIGVFGYLLDDSNAIGEINRVLRTNGYACVSVQNMMSLANLDFVFRHELLEKLQRRRSPWRSSDGTAWFLPTAPNESSYRYKLYVPRALERSFTSRGFTVVDTRTFGHEFRLARRFRLMTESVLTKMETGLDRLTSRHRIPFLSYAGETYSMIVRKSLERV